MNRILVIGSNGAGKSTFSYHLAKKTGLPLIHLDQIHWHGAGRDVPQKSLNQLFCPKHKNPAGLLTETM